MIVATGAVPGACTREVRCCRLICRRTSAAGSKSAARSGDVRAQHPSSERDLAAVLLFAPLKGTNKCIPIDQDHDCTLQASRHKQRADFLQKSKKSHCQESNPDGLSRQRQPWKSSFRGGTPLGHHPPFYSPTSYRLISKQLRSHKKLLTSVPVAVVG